MYYILTDHSKILFCFRDLNSEGLSFSEMSSSRITSSSPSISSDANDTSYSMQNEARDSHATPIIISLNKASEKSVEETHSKSYEADHCYDKSSSGEKEFIVNNHEAHQHSPPKIPSRNVDGTIVIEPAHSNSFTKNLSRCDGAVALIKDHFEVINSHVSPEKDDKECFEKSDTSRNFDSTNQVHNPANYDQKPNSKGFNSRDNDNSTPSQQNDVSIQQWISKINSQPQKIWLSDQNSVVVVDDATMRNTYLLQQQEIDSGNKFISVACKDGNEIRLHAIELQEVVEDGSEKLLRPSSSNSWEVVKSEKGIRHSHGESSEIRIQQECPTWQTDQTSITHADVNAWMNTSMQNNVATNNNIQHYIENYEHNQSPMDNNSDMWKKKREIDAHRAWEEQCQEIKQEMDYSVLKHPEQDMNKAHIICQDSEISKSDGHDSSNHNEYAYSVIQDSKLWHQTNENPSSTYVLMDGIQSKLFVSKQSNSETADHIDTNWQENKNKTTQVSQQWIMDNAHLHADMAAGDPWMYQTVSTGTSQPIRTHTGDMNSRLRSDNGSHSLPPTPPSREGLTPRTAPMSQSIAPSVGERDRASDAGTSNASDSVMVSTFGSMAPYSMAGNYSSPPSYSGRDLYPGKPSSGYEASPPSSATLYASPTSGLAMLPYVAGQSMGGHQSMVSQSGHHWSGSQGPSVHDHQQSAGGYGISSLTSGLNLGQNSLNLSTSQSGNDQGELSRTAGFASFAASGHGYLRPDMSHWGILDPTMSGLHNTYCTDGIPPHLAQGKFEIFIFNNK